MMQRGRAEGGSQGRRHSRRTDLTLGDISDWRVGDLLPLKASAVTKIRLDCKSQPLFWCELGQAKGHYTLKMADRVDVEEMPLAQFLELAGAAEQS